MSKLDSIKYKLLELKDLGLTGSIYRILFEFSLISGLYKYHETNLFNRFIGWQSPISLNDWQAKKQGFFIDTINPNISTFINKISTQKKSDIIQIADKSLSGEIFCFSRWFANYGSPINWHLNPVKNQCWPKDIHWSKAMKYTDGGDIKLVWEVNRFPQVYHLVRAYYLTNDSKYVKGFIDQISSWEKQNPFLLGVNWASGQELAIRVFAWIFGLYNFYQTKEFTDQDFRLIIKLIYLHILHINHNIHYAYIAVHNNHLIGEALALYIVGTLFPFMPDAGKWKKKGRNILAEKCLEQFYEDGGYCQLSHTYHRLALHYYLWAFRIGELDGDKFPDEVYKILKKSADYLYQNTNLFDGQLSNWGSNDGALLNPMTSCDFTDFRPAITSIYRVCGVASPFPKGLWDEESIWFLGEIKDEKQETIIQKSQSFPQTGIHVLRHNKQDYCVFRCGTPLDRFGQADQLHLDVFLDGHNIVSDGGSYLYNDELRYHNYFMGTLSHNTITVDNQDQMLLWRRFKWLYKSKAKLLEFDTANKIASGEHYGYLRNNIGIIHKRKIKFDSSKIIVKDDITNINKKIHDLNLLWNLNVKNTELLQNDIIKTIKLYNEKKEYWMYIWSTGETESDNINIYKGFDDSRNVDGWLSRYYGEKTKIYSVNFRKTNNDSNMMYSVLSKTKLNQQDIIKCEFS